MVLPLSTMALSSVFTARQQDTRKGHVKDIKFSPLHDSYTGTSLSCSNAGSCEKFFPSSVTTVEAVPVSVGVFSVSVSRLQRCAVTSAQDVLQLLNPCVRHREVVGLPALGVLKRHADVARRGMF